MDEDARPRDGRPNYSGTPKKKANETGRGVKYEFDGGSVRISWTDPAVIIGGTSKPWKVSYRPVPADGKAPAYQFVSTFSDLEDAENYAEGFIAGDEPSHRNLVPFFLEGEAATLNRASEGQYVWTDESQGRSGEARNYSVTRTPSGVWEVGKSEIVSKEQAYTHGRTSGHVQNCETRKEAIIVAHSEMVSGS